MISEHTPIPIPTVYGLEDLIAGQSPSLSGWDTDPDDESDMTDGDISTVCDTGFKICDAGWQSATFEWDLGDEYNILITAIGKPVVTAGTGYIYAYIYSGGVWRKSCTQIGISGRSFMMSIGGLGSRVRLTLMNSAACTMSPSINDVKVWRMK